MIFTYSQYLFAASLALLAHVSIAYLLLAEAPLQAPPAGHAMSITLTTSGSATRDMVQGGSKPAKTPSSQPQMQAIPQMQAMAPPPAVPLKETLRPKPQQSPFPKPVQHAPRQRSAAPTKRAPKTPIKPAIAHRHEATEVTAERSSSSTKGGQRDAVAAPLGGNVPPSYPALARRRGYQGRVVVRVSVQANGGVGSAVVTQSSGHNILDEAALEAVRQWRFRPAQRAGRSVNATLDVPVVFQLEQG